MNDRPFPERPMGERMTEGQIEDVLAAIRRLVSDEALSAARAGARRVPDAPPPRLILTAAQRVRTGADLPRAVEVIGAAVPAQGFESDTGDASPAAADWTAAMWGLPGADKVAPDEPPTAADTAWVNRAEAEIVAALAADQPGPTAALSGDEDRLRDLIREILREELHGRLGERITTNVRKLVRAEINRLITLHDAQS
jgi:cell pole-organizing protein PopZ